MKTEDLFKFGVTPKEGPHAGEKFEVTSVDRDVVYVRGKDGRNNFPHGSYRKHSLTTMTSDRPGAILKRLWKRVGFLTILFLLRI